MYGAYPTAAVQRLHAPKVGFHVRGHAPSLEVLASARVLLAPLRYGAGIKGKIVDAWRYGTPVVTTPIGAEGMGAEGNVRMGTDTGAGNPGVWGGLVAGDAASFAESAIQLCTDESAWVGARCNSRRLLRELYAKEPNLDGIRAAVQRAAEDLTVRRARDYSGAVLWQQTARSTEYFSRWIELKEAGSTKSASINAKQEKLRNEALPEVVIEPLSEQR